MVEIYEKQGGKILVATEKEEIAIIIKYLPAQNERRCHS
ncbi:MAG: GatB/YqeY domain-containing protein [Bacteroidetes bacterium]|nr:GatB/YqeY domain-containing protein [Bacteroidota bacterium]